MRRQQGEVTTTTQAKMEDLSNAKYSVLKAVKCLPEDCKIDFGEALTRVPLLVEKESNPLVFLRFENDDAEAAARRLANYWKDRVATFKERAFLPMNLSGEGVLTEQEIDMFAAGSVVRLPNDQAGRPVLCLALDRIKRSPASVTRVLYPKFVFYQLAMLALENPEICRTEGVVMIRHMQDTTMDQQIEHALAHSFCLKLFSLQLCYFVPPAKGWNLNTKQVLAWYIQAYGKEFASRIYVHMEHDPVAMLEKLSKHCLDTLTVPTTMGGSWHYASFEGWLQHGRARDKAALGAQEPTTRATSPVPIKKCISKQLDLDPNNPQHKKDLKALEAENERLLQDLAVSFGSDALDSERIFESLIESIEDVEEGEKIAVREIATELAGCIDKGQADPLSFENLEALHVRVRFAFGVLTMLQEEKNYSSLRRLMQDPDTDEVLRVVLSPEQAESSGLDGPREASSVATSDTNNFVDDVNSIWDSPTHISSNRQPSHLNEDIFSKVKQALGILSVLEETAACQFEKLLERSEVEGILRELVGPPVVPPLRAPQSHHVPESEGKGETPTFLDVLADRVANKILTMANSGSLTPDLSKHLLPDSSRHGGVKNTADDETSNLVGALLDSALSMI